MKRTKKSRRSATCYICVQPGADTKDHVIPSGFFPQPLPTNLVTLPAHYSCQNRLSEDYARAILAGMSYETIPLRVRERVLWSLVKSDLKGRKLRQDVVRTLVRFEIRSPAGLFLGYTQGVHFDRNRVYPMLEKIVRGLYYHHTGRFLSANARFSWDLFSLGLNESVDLSVFAQCDTGLSYPGVFECRYGIASDDTVEGSAWWLRFYEGVVFHCVTSVMISAATSNVVPPTFSLTTPLPPARCSLGLRPARVHGVGEALVS